MISRYDSILKAYSHQIQQGTEGKDRLQLDETLCVLEVCTAMTVAPAVADAALQLGSLQQVVALASTCQIHCMYKQPDKDSLCMLVLPCFCVHIILIARNIDVADSQAMSLPGYVDRKCFDMTRFPKRT